MHFLTNPLADLLYYNQKDILQTQALDDQYRRQKFCENDKSIWRKYFLLKEIHPDDLHALNRGFESCWVMLSEVDDLIIGSRNCDQLVLNTIRHTTGGIDFIIPKLEYKTT